MSATQWGPLKGALWISRLGACSQGPTLTKNNHYKTVAITEGRTKRHGSNKKRELDSSRGRAERSSKRDLFIDLRGITPGTKVGPWRQSWESELKESKHGVGRNLNYCRRAKGQWCWGAKESINALSVKEIAAWRKAPPTRELSLSPGFPPAHLGLASAETASRLTQVPRVLLPPPLQPLPQRVQLLFVGLDRTPRVRHPVLPAWTSLESGAADEHLPAGVPGNIQFSRGHSKANRKEIPGNALGGKVISGFALALKLKKDPSYVLAGWRTYFLLALSRAAGRYEALVAMLVPGSTAMLLIGAHAAMLNTRTTALRVDQYVYY